MSNTSIKYTNGTDAQSQSSNHLELSEDYTVAFLIAASSSLFLDFLDERLRAAEHHYFDHGDDFSLGYLEAMQDMYSSFRHWHEVTHAKAVALDDDSTTLNAH